MVTRNADFVLLTIKEKLKWITSDMPLYTVRKRSCRSNVFTPVCQSFCSVMYVYPSMHWGRPPRQTLPHWADPPRPVPAGIHATPPPPAATAADGTYPTRMHPCYVKKSARWKVNHIQEIFRSRAPRRPLLRMVRILLECILVM